MSMFSRLFKKRYKAPEVELPNDQNLGLRLEAAKRANSRAVSSFVEETKKQERDARYARRVIADVLERADRIKVMEHASIKK